MPLWPRPGEPEAVPGFESWRDAKKASHYVKDYQQKAVPLKRGFQI